MGMPSRRVAASRWISSCAVKSAQETASGACLASPRGHASPLGPSPITLGEPEPEPRSRPCASPPESRSLAPSCPARNGHSNHRRSLRRAFDWSTRVAHAHRDHLHRRRSPDRQDRQHQFQLYEPEARGFRAVGRLGNDRRRRSRGVAGGVSHGRRARRRGHRQWRSGAHRRRSVAGDRRPRRRRRFGVERGLAGPHGGVLSPAQPGHVGQQPQAGDAADRRRDPGQSGRHRLRLCPRYRPGRGFSSPRGCRANCFACSKSRSSRAC